MLWCDMANDVMWYIGCMRWSCCNRNIDLHVDGTATGRSHRVVFILTYVLADAFTILLGCSFSSNSKSSTTTPMATRWWMIMVWRRWQEDRAGALVMEIKKHVMMAISCHLWIACDVNPFMHLILLRTTVALWGDLSLKFQDEIVFSPTVHRCDSSSFRDTTWWSGVIDSTFTYNGCKTVAHAEHSG